MTDYLSTEGGLKPPATPSQTPLDPESSAIISSVGTQINGNSYTAGCV